MPGWSMTFPQLLASLAGDFGIAEVRNVAGLEAARQTGFVWTTQLGVVCLAMNKDYLRTAVDNPHVVCIIVPAALAGQTTPADKSLVACAKPDELYHHLHLNQIADSDEDTLDVDETAVVDDSAVLRGQVRIGAGAHIGPRAVISGPVVIGGGARIDAGAIVGCDGLYTKDVQGVRRHMPHHGGVEIGADAYIHAGAVIVRSAIRGEATRVGKGAHVGVLSNIGHDAQVGEAATISSNVVLAGRARVGARAWIGASSTISNSLEIGEGAKVRLGAVVVGDVPGNGDVSGNFASAHAGNMKRFLRDIRNGH